MKQILKPDTNQNTPWVVWYIIITAIAQYILINYKDSINFIDANVFILLGAPDSVNIYNGQYWGVLTNNFLHLYLSQLILNCLGIIIYGYFIEKRIGFIKFSIIVVIAGIIPSIFQLNLTDQPGIGLSGINFTLFGFTISKAFIDKGYRLKWIYLYLLIMISIILYFSFYNLYVSDVYRSEAMSFGFILGLLLGYLSNKNKMSKVTVLFIIMFLSVSTLFYAPWSSEWQVFKGYQAHKNKDFTEARNRYEKALKIDPENIQAIDNITLLKLDKLKLKAYKAFIKEDYKRAKKIYEEILQISPNDDWALNAYKELQ